MATIRRNATSTLQSGWVTRVPNVSAHLNIAEDVDTPNESTYVLGQIDQLNEYGSFDFSAIPSGSIINSVTVRQWSLNEATQGSRVTRFALKINGTERAAASFNVTNEVAAKQSVEFRPSLTRDEVATGISITKLTIPVGAGENPPIPEG